MTLLITPKQALCNELRLALEEFVRIQSLDTTTERDIDTLARKILSLERVLTAYERKGS